MRSSKTAVLWLTLVAVSSGQSSTPQANPADPAARLPITRVILYKNGVGYFEHAGHVRGSQDVNVDFTTAQLNDVLKSLTVLDLGKGRITGVSYNSAAPLEKRLGSLRLPVGENPTTAQFLDALRGARVEIHSGSLSASGRLLSIEEREVLTAHDAPKGDGTDEGKPGGRIGLTQVSLVSDGGEVRLFDLTPATSVRVTERDVNDEVGKYLGLVASTRDQDVRRMTISTAGEGDRTLLVSYISEVPVWKSTYRIVIPKEGKPLLQGWAIVDNTVGEDWKDVELSLVAGAPQSFVQELSQPYYTRRPVVALPENAMLTPQTHEAAIQTEIENGAPAIVSGGVVGGVPGGVPGGSMGGVIGSIASGSGGGVGSGVYRTNGAPPPVAPRPDTTMTAESLEQGTTVGESRELGDLFEYKVKDRVTIHKNQSALVPILQSRIDAEKVSVWNPSESSVLRALWVNNTTDLTLDGGSFNVLEGDAFAGEGLMDAIKPGEKRIMSYAADLGVLVDAKQKADNQRVTNIAIAHGSMTQSTQEREENTYTVRNRDTSTRTVVIEHPARPGWKLTDDAKPAESSASFHRFRLTVEPKKTATLLVKEYRPIMNSYQLTNVTDDEIKFFVNQKMINPDVEKALRRIVSQKNDIAVLDAVITGRRAQVSSISEDQQRVRENMKALKGSSEEKALVERYVRELNDQEDRVQALRHEITELQQKRDAAQGALNGMIEALQMEVTL
jgi:archaellum component FlaC